MKKVLGIFWEYLIRYFYGHFLGP